MGRRAKNKKWTEEELLGQYRRKYPYMKISERILIDDFSERRGISAVLRCVRCNSWHQVKIRSRHSVEAAAAFKAGDFNVVVLEELVGQMLKGLEEKKEVGYVPIKKSSKENIDETTFCELCKERLVEMYRHAGISKLWVDAVCMRCEHRGIIKWDGYCDARCPLELSRERVHYWLEQGRAGSGENIPRAKKRGR